MAAPIDIRPKENLTTVTEENLTRCYCWPFCPKSKKLKHYHNRELTQHEIDYTRIIIAERIAQKALEERK